MYKPSLHSSRLRLIVLTLLFALLPFVTFAQTEIAGEVSGEWTAEDSPYIVVDSTWVPEGEELSIGPGVDVLFGEGLGIDVFGTITAEGTEDDSVRFLPLEEEETWRGLHLFGWWPWDENYITFSAIRGADNALLLGSDVRIYINNCNIKSVNIPIGEFPRDGGGKRIEITNSVILGGDWIELTRSGLFAVNTIFRAGPGENGRHWGIYNSFGTTSLDTCTVYGSCPNSSDVSTYYRNSRFLVPNDSTQLRVYISGTMTDCYVEGFVRTGISGRMNIIENNHIEGRLSIERGSARIVNNTVGEDIRINSCDSVRVDSCIVQGSLSISDSDYIMVRNVTTFGALNVSSDDDYVNNYFIERCTIYGRIFTNCESGRTEIINNTIIRKRINGLWEIISLYGNAPTEIRNNIIVADDDEIPLLYPRRLEGIEALVFKYNCIWGTDYIVYGNRYDFELDESNILENPQLVSLDSPDFHLTEVSPCIDSGDPDSPLDPDSTRADMGAFYFHHENAVLDYTAPTLNDFELFSAYPNPFNSTTTIRYNMPTQTHVSLEVYNLAGQRITKMFEGYMQAGFHSSNLIASDLPSGTYIIRLKAFDNVLTQNVMLIR